MKIFLLLLVSLLLNAPIVRAKAFQSPDILVDSKLDANWTSVLFSKVRRLLKNYNIEDPFNGRIDSKIIVDESVVEEFLSEDSKQLMEDIGKISGLEILKGKTSVSLEGFAYNVKNFKANLKPTTQEAGGLTIASDYSASELDMSADKVTLGLYILSKNKSPVINIEIIKPRIRAREDRLINFFAKIKIEDQKSFYRLKLLKSNFEGMAHALASNPENVELGYDDIIIPDVSIKIGNKSLVMYPDKIKKLLRSREGAIKGFLIAQMSSMLKQGTISSSLKVIEDYKIDKEYWLGSDIIKSQFMISQFASSFRRQNLEVTLPGDFCTSRKYSVLKDKCLHSKDTKVAESRLDKNLFQGSQNEIKSIIDEGEANIVASLSEDYINKLLVTTYDAGLWKDTLDEAEVELGPKKVSMRLDSLGDAGTLTMDVMYKPKGLERLALGTKLVRFPLVLKVSMRIEKYAGVPVIIIRLNDVDLSDKTLLEGVPELGIKSTIGAVPRLKKAVLKTIRSKIEGMKNKDVLELRYPEFSGLGLEKVHFKSDGHGRMNAVMRIEDLIDEQDR